MERGVAGAASPGGRAALRVAPIFPRRFIDPWAEKAKTNMGPRHNAALPEKSDQEFHLSGAGGCGRIFLRISKAAAPRVSNAQVLGSGTGAP